MTRKVLVLTDEPSPTVDAVCDHVSELGGHAHILSVRRLPSGGDINVDDVDAMFGRNGQYVDLHACAGIWLWHTERPQANDPEPDTARYVRREWELAVLGLASVTSPRAWINHPRASRWMESNKLAQARLARTAGLDVPPTLLSNDPERILEFAAGYESVAVKSQGGVRRDRPEGPQTTFTQRCTFDELAESCKSLARAPVLVQPYLEKADEFRATIVDNDVFLCRIDSQASERTRVDWRRYDFDRVSHTLVPAEKHLNEKLKALMRMAGLRYAAIDLIRTPEDRLYFLDLNPSGQYHWIEALTGAPISRRLASALLDRNSAGLTSLPHRPAFSRTNASSVRTPPS